MGKVWGSLALGGVVAAGVVWAVSGREGAPEGAVLYGDHAPALVRALGIAPSPEHGAAAVTVATVNTWVQVAYLQGLGALCDTACTGETWLVRVVEPRPVGSRKTVFVRLAPFGDGNDWPPVPACLRAVLAAEMSSLRPGDLPACAKDLPEPVTRTLLPFGLGVL